MTRDFREGFIVGLSLPPLSVSVQSGGESENFCAVTALSGGIQSDEGFCEYIEF